MLGEQVPVPCMEGDPLLPIGGSLTTPMDEVKRKAHANETNDQEVEIGDEIVW